MSEMEALKQGMDTVNFKGKQGELTVEVKSMFGGLNWLFKNCHDESLSVICHGGSYGRECGLFEIMPSWNSKACKRDQVIGHLSFGEVQIWIRRLVKRGRK